MQPKYLIGTLFDEEQINKKTNQDNIKQKDPMGNTRWKGAFTGGFEAGFKNTCGSKQGFQPKQFVSSIGNRATRKDQDVFDFMDKEDLGRESIGNNIELQGNFSTQNRNPLNITVQESIGEKILSELKKGEALNTMPQNQEDLERILKYYEKSEIAQKTNQRYVLKDLEKPFTVSATNFEVENDEFIDAYENLYRKVIRAGVKEETEEEIQKRREQNKIYFDFSKPLEEEPQYLKELHDLDELSKPKKRKKNPLHSFRLKDIFVESTSFQEYHQQQFQIQKAPKYYDPFHRIKEAGAQFFGNAKKSQVEEEDRSSSKHRIHSVQQRTDIFGSERLSNKFRSATTSSFVKGSQDKVNKIKQFFSDSQKNQRFMDYVDELQGRKISSKIHQMSWEEAEKQRVDFEKAYEKMKRGQKSEQKQIPQQLESVLQQAKKQALNKRFVRTVTEWRPEQTLCKRFGCLVPYKIQKPKRYEEEQSYF